VPGHRPPGRRSRPPDVEWRAYGGTYASARYSPLAQIDRTNVGRLRVAWRWRSPDHDVMAQNSIVETFVNEATPLMVGGVLYVAPRGPGGPPDLVTAGPRSAVDADQDVGPGGPLAGGIRQDETGAMLARVELPANAQGALMTYMTRGRQYIVIPVGGANLPAELIALSLP